MRVSSHRRPFRMMMRLFAVSLMLLMSAQAQQENSQKSQPDKKTKRIVFLGDSITAGYGLEKKQAYPAIIEALAKKEGRQWKCVNAGLSGDTTSGGVRRIRILTRSSFDMIVVALGGNDGLRGIKPQVTKQNLVTILETVRAKQPQAEIILVGIAVPENMGKGYTQEFLKTFKSVASDKSVVLYENLIEGIAGAPEFNQADVIHPNEKGQGVIASKLYQQLKLQLDND